MNEAIKHFVGNRSPSLFGTITVDGVPVDLTTSTVKLQMRAVTSATLKVDTSAIIVTPLAGAVRYDWAALDVDTAGRYDAWWRVTNAGGLIQDTPEFMIEILAHATAGNEYVSVAELKETLSLQGKTFADQDLSDSVTAASRVIDSLCGRRFYPDTDAAQVRYYSPMSPGRLEIDDLITLTTLQTDDAGNGTFSTTWAAADYILEPMNAAGESRPWETVRKAHNGSKSFSEWPKSVKVTGKFGWTTPPADVKRATLILASRILKRSREATFGIISFDVEGGAIRIPRTDPDVAMMISDYVRRVSIE